MTVKFNKLEFLKLFSHVLHVAILLIFVFKENGALSTALLL